MELRKTENIVTGNKRFYIDGIRVSEHKYNFKLDYNFASCFYTLTKGNLRKHFVIINKKKQR